MSSATYAYLGPPGTFTEAALLTVPGVSDATLAPCSSVPAALDCVRAGEADAALVPIENSVEGAVPVTLDELASGHLVIVREVLLPVSFALLARPGTELESCKRVATHPHAAAQTRKWLARTLPDAEMLHASSTAAAAAATAEPGSPYDAAIAPRLAAQRYDLHVIADEIEDNADAVTRFVLVARPEPRSESSDPGRARADAGRTDGGRADADRADADRAEVSPIDPIPTEVRGAVSTRPNGPTGPTGADKTSVVAFIRDDHPGALQEILDEFAVRGVNLTWIQSRPTGHGLGRYCFSIDCEGHLDESRVAEALMGLRRVCADVRFLGSYPRADGVRATLRSGTTDADFEHAASWLDDLRNGRPTD